MVKRKIKFEVKNGNRSWKIKKYSLLLWKRKLIVAEELLDLFLKALFVDWLKQNGIHADCQTFPYRLLIICCGHGDYYWLHDMRVFWQLADFCVLFEDVLSWLGALHDGHVVVHEDKFEVCLTAGLPYVAFVHFPALLSVLCTFDLYAIGRSQHRLKGHHIIVVVFNDQNSRYTIASSIC